VQALCATTAQPRLDQGSTMESARDHERAISAEIRLRDAC